MTTLQEMHQKTTSSSEYNRMRRSVALLHDIFGVNHFYYSKILSSGYCSLLGTQSSLQEHMFDNIEIIKSCPVLRHPSSVKLKVNLLKNHPDKIYQNFLHEAKEKFQINFTINISKKIPNGVVAYGFGVESTHPRVDEVLLNEVPLLETFFDYFCEENKKLIDIADEHPVHIASLLGDRFFEEEDGVNLSLNKDSLLKLLGLKHVESLTEREVHILRYLSHGYPSRYIADRLYLSNRTVENYIANIKLKLSCDSKATLIEKAQKITSIID